MCWCGAERFAVSGLGNDSFARDSFPVGSVRDVNFWFGCWATFLIGGGAWVAVLDWILECSLLVRTGGGVVDDETNGGNMLISTDGTIAFVVVVVVVVVVVDADTVGGPVNPSTATTAVVVVVVT